MYAISVLCAWTFYVSNVRRILAIYLERISVFSTSQKHICIRLNIYIMSDLRA